MKQKQQILLDRPKKSLIPEYLEKEDTIAVLSPAGAVPEQDAQDAIRMIEDRGYRAFVMPHTFGSYSQGYAYSGTPEARFTDFNNALQDQEVKAIWTTRGGYGCMHLLPYLDFGKKKHIPWIIGYSDVTALQSALLREKNVCSIHGQSLRKASFGVNSDAYEAIFNVMEGEFPNFEFDAYAQNRQGAARGQLIGGNLSLIYALLGTDYSYKFKKRILFIEEIGEKLYALDRMLMALKLAGVFNKIGGLIIGGMSQMGDVEGDEYDSPYSTTAYNLIFHHVKEFDFPVAFGFPNGHIYDNFPLVIGAEVVLQVSENTSRMLYV